MAQNTLSLVFKAQDDASGPMEDIAHAVGHLPRQMHEASAALSVLEGGLESAGSEALHAAGKLAGLGQLVLSGGPIGLGLAAITAATWAGTEAWKHYTENARLLEGFGKAVEGSFKKADDEIDKERENLAKLQDQVRFFGKTADEVQLIKMGEGFKHGAEQAADLRAQIELLKVDNQRLATVTEVYIAQAGNGFVDVQKRQTEAAAEQVKVNEKLISFAQEEISKIEAKAGVQAKEGEETARLIQLEHQHEEAKRAKIEALKEEKQRTEDLIQTEQRYRQHVAESLQAGFQDQVQYYQRIAELQEQDAKSFEKAEKEKVEKYKSEAKEMIDVTKRIGEAMGTQVQAMMAGTKSVSQAVKAMAAVAGQEILDMVEKSIMAYAVQAEAAAMANNVGIPVVGPILGAAAAAVAFGVVKGFLGQLHGMADGGVASGGILGHDSVPALLTPGERVLTTQQTESFERLVDMLDKPGTGRGSGPGGQVNHIVMAPQFHSQLPPERITKQRILRDMRKELLAELQRMGLA